MSALHQQTADTIQRLIEDLERRIPEADLATRPALEAQLENQRVSLAYVKRKGGLS